MKPRYIEKQSISVIITKRATKRKHEPENPTKAVVSTNYMQQHTCRDVKVILDRNVVKAWLNDKKYKMQDNRKSVNIVSR